jgi:hypothetical protein
MHGISQPFQHPNFFRELQLDIERVSFKIIEQELSLPYPIIKLKYSKNILLKVITLQPFWPGN